MRKRTTNWAARLYAADFFDPYITAAGALIGISYLLTPEVAEKSPVGRQVEVLPVLWSTLYLLAFATVLIAIRLGDEHVRSAGMFFVAAGWALQGIPSLAYEFHPVALFTGDYFDARPLIYPMAAIFCALRAWLLAPPGARRAGR